MKYIYKILRAISFALVFVLFAPVLSGQEHENTLLRAMKDEMNRSKNELKLPDSPSPFFVSYTVAEISYISVTGTTGTTLNVKESPKERVHSVNLYVGDSKFSSDYSFTGNGILSTSLTSSEDNYLQLRRNFWQTSDLAYKMAVEVFNSKQNTIKNANLSEEEKSLADMLPLKKIEKRVSPPAPFNLNREQYESLTKIVSAEFLKHNQLFDTKVNLAGIEAKYYLTSTEGTEIIEPAGYVSLEISGKIRTSKGQILTDREVILVRNFEELPSSSELKSFVNNFSSRLNSLKGASEIEEYYLGPVLFMNEAAATILSDNLISPSGIFAYRKPVQVMASTGRVENISARRDIKPLEERLNKKVIDSRITVTNRTDLKSYKGIPLLGHYSIDAQGVAPIEEFNLIDKGILKNLLSTRVPTKTSKSSTGSLRYGVRPRSVSLDMAPGTLVISATGGATSAELKKELIKAAKEEGLEYAYIVRKIANQSDQYIYRVSVKNGEERLVYGAEITPVQLTKLKRVLGVCREQKVYNYLYQGTIPTSVIYPDGILIEDIEINKKTISVVKESPLIVQ
jgi:predicted Zn-dependent protease